MKTKIQYVYKKTVELIIYIYIIDIPWNIIRCTLLMMQSINMSLKIMMVKNLKDGLS